MELTADGLTLREPVKGDAVTLVASVSASLRELSPWLAWAHAGYDEADALRWIRGELGDEHRFLMVDAGGRHVGTCGLNRVDRVNRTANLGYWVHSDHVGHGYATTATKLLAAYGVGEAGLHRLEVVISVQNHASQRVAEKAGATFEGTARGALRLQDRYHDALVWSFLAGDDPEWQNPR